MKKRAHPLTGRRDSSAQSRISDLFTVMYLATDQLGFVFHFGGSIHHQAMAMLTNPHLYNHYVIQFNGKQVFPP